MRDVLVDEERRTGRASAELSAAVIPSHSAELWQFYSTLTSGRTQAFSGLAPISSRDVEALGRLLQIELSPWEAETLLLLDAAVREEARKEGDSTKQDAKQ